MNDKVTRDNMDAEDEVVGQARRPEQLHFAPADTAGAVACGLSTIAGVRVFWTSDRDVFDRAGLAACHGCKAALAVPPTGVCIPGCVLCADAVARWVRDNKRAPTLTEKGRAPSPERCNACNEPLVEEAMGLAVVMLVCPKCADQRAGTLTPEAEDREALAEKMRDVWLQAPPPDRRSWLAVADYILGRYPVGVVLSTDGDQAKDAEIQALRKALADAEERCDSEALRDADVYRTIGILTGSSFVTEGVAGAVERVVNERETWRVRALNAEKSANRAERERNAATARAEEAEYLLTGARKKLAEVEAVNERLRDELGAHVRLLNTTRNERDRAERSLAMAERAATLTRALVGNREEQIQLLRAALDALHVVADIIGKATPDVLRAAERATR